jgi:hypothetical protein
MYGFGSVARFPTLLAVPAAGNPNIGRWLR